MSTPPSLRPASPADLPAVRALLEANRLPDAELERYLDHFVVAEAGGRIVGCGGLEVYGESGLLRSVAVDEAWRGRGLGARLTEWALERARSLGVRKLYLFTMSAPGFFARVGFAPVSLDGFPPAARRSAQYQAVRRHGDRWGIVAMHRQL